MTEGVISFFYTRGGDRDESLFGFGGLNEFFI